MTQNRRRQGGPIKAAEDVLPTAPPDPLAALRDQPPSEQRGDLPDLSGSGEQTPTGSAPEGPDAGPASESPEPSGPEPVGQPLVTEDDQREHIAAAVAALHADTTALGFLHKGGSCGCRYITGVVVRTVLPLNIAADDPEEFCPECKAGTESAEHFAHTGGA